MYAHEAYRLNNVNQAAKHNNPVKNNIIEIAEYCLLKDLDLSVIKNKVIDLARENN